MALKGRWWRDGCGTPWGRIHHPSPTSSPVARRRGKGQRNHPNPNPNRNRYGASLRLLLPLLLLSCQNRPCSSFAFPGKVRASSLAPVGSARPRAHSSLNSWLRTIAPGTRIDAGSQHERRAHYGHHRARQRASFTLLEARRGGLQGEEDLDFSADGSDDESYYRYSYFAREGEIQQQQQQQQQSKQRPDGPIKIVRNKPSVKRKQPTNSTARATISSTLLSSSTSSPPAIFAQNSMSMLSLAYEEFKDWASRTVARNIRGMKYEFDRRQWRTSVKKWWTRSLEADEAARLEFFRMYRSSISAPSSLLNRQSQGQAQSSSSSSSPSPSSGAPQGMGVEGQTSFLAEEEWDNIYSNENEQLLARPSSRDQALAAALIGSRPARSSASDTDSENYLDMSAASSEALPSGDGCADVEEDEREEEEEEEEGVIDYAINGEWMYDDGGTIPTFKPRP